MVLVVQLYAPLSDDLVKPLRAPYPKNRDRDEFNRVLHVLACVEKGCTGVRCLRSAQRDAGWAEAGKQDRKRKAQQKQEEDRRKTTERSLNPFASKSSVSSVGEDLELPLARVTSWEIAHYTYNPVISSFRKHFCGSWVPDLWRKR